MTEANYQFGRVASIHANAVGQPGSRRFRLLIEASNGATAILWMEKEQLFNLAVAMKNLIDQVEESAKRGRRSGGAGRVEARVSNAERLEFQTGRMAVGYDEDSALFLILGNELEEPEGSLPRVSLLADQKTMDGLADEVFEVCAAGRPLCPLCGAPMNPNETHICPKHNGYHSGLGEMRDT